LQDQLASEGQARQNMENRLAQLESMLMNTSMEVVMKK